MKTNLLSMNSLESKEILKIKDNYSRYKDSQQSSKSPYAILDKSLSLYFPFLSNGSIKLYMLYVFQAKNKTGESWHSTQSQADALGVTRRSIDKWNSELLNAQLIARVPNNKSSMSTFILPISDYQLDSPKLGNMIQYDKEQLTQIDGKLSYIFHLYQWRKNKDSGEYTDVYRLSCFVYVKKINLVKNDLKLNRSIKKIIIEEQSLIDTQTILLSNNDIIEEFYVTDLFYRKETPYGEYFTENKEINQQGFVVSSKFNLQNKKERLSIISELADQIEYIQSSEDIPSTQIVSVTK